MVGAGNKSQGPLVPPVGHRDTQRMPARGKPRRVHRDGLVLQPLVVAGPARRKPGVPQLGAVQLRLINTVGRDVQPGGRDRRVDGKLCLKHRQRVFALKRIGDPLGRKPIRPPQACFNPRFGACRLAVVVTYLHLNAVGGARLRRRPGIGHKQGIAALHAAGVPASHPHAVGGLDCVGDVAHHFPGKNGLLIQPDGVVPGRNLQFGQFQHRNGLLFATCAFLCPLYRFCDGASIK